MAHPFQTPPNFRDLFTPSAPVLPKPGAISENLHTLTEQLKRHRLQLADDKTPPLSEADLPALAAIVSALESGDRICPEATSWTYYAALELDHLHLYPNHPTAIPRTLAHTLHAVGMAWAMAYSQQPSIMVITFRAEHYPLPALHQALNFSGVRDAPVIFVCHSHSDFAPLTGVTTFAQVALSYGVRAQRLTAAHAEDVHVAMLEAASLARGGQGPTCLELEGS
ncbi:MAG: hypothetical protein KTR25_09540 [Myxococcales bacterium]|nr:hypothetical protein [Myxococcales bacterium]